MPLAENKVGQASSLPLEHGSDTKGQASGLSYIEARELGFRYAFRKRPVFSGINLELERGETVLLLGPSGCGKSTLALCLNGLIPQSIEGEMQGEVQVDGLPTRTAPLAELARRVGIVFQDPESQFCMLTVDDEVAFGLENIGVPRAEIDARIDAALQSVGLLAQRQTRLDRLSGGMKQRLALACLLAMQPEALILDEPTANLDPRGAAEFLNALAPLRQGRALLIIEHRLDELIHLVDRALLMNSGGQIVHEGAPRDILAGNAEFLEAQGIWLPQVSELAWRLRQAGIDLNPFPLTVEEAAATLRQQPWRAVRQEETREPDATPPAIEINHLSFAYPRGPRVLDAVQLQAPRGSFVALLGPNGAGKTTLAMHLINILRPPAGTVRILGQDMAALSTYELTQQVGYVFQNPEHQFVADTVYDELAYSLRARRMAEAEVKQQVDQLLADFALTEHAAANPFRLSQGQKRRLSLATMLAVGQKMLILDEPTFGQDRRSAQQIMQHLRRLNEGGVTILMITHDMSLVAEYARQAAVLLNGRIVYQGAVREMFHQNTLLTQASLQPPPLYQLAQRMRQADPSFPDLLTMRDWVAAYTEGER
jgi:energy-coupling factor transport system ATP-binding protein